MKHTPEPWTIDSLHTDMNGKLRIYHSSERRFSNIADVNKPHDAARIVACVNACAGMEDPAAEIPKLRAAVADWLDIEDRDE